jgi:predicted PurR-regulated permease PerM
MCQTRRKIVVVIVVVVVVVVVIVIVVVVVVIVALVEKVIADQNVVITNKPNENKKIKQNQFKEESGLQLGQWSSCCMGPESNVLAIHRLSPLTFNINCIRLTNNFHQNHVKYVFSTIALIIFTLS